MYFSSKVISKTHDFIANYVISAPLSPLYSNKHYAQRTDGVFVLSYGCKILLKSFYKQLLKNLISCVNSIVDNTAEEPLQLRQVRKSSGHAHRKLIRTKNTEIL